MAIDHTHDAGPKPLEQNTFRSAEMQANGAFQNQLQTASLDRNVGRTPDTGSFNLPKIDFFDSGAKGTSGPGKALDGASLPADKPADRPADKPADKPALAAPVDSNDHTGKIGDDLKGRIVKAIGANEGDLTNINKNDNGHGISVGIRQWNQKRGELPDLLKAMHDKNPEKFNETFGPFAKNLQSEKWVRHANMAGNPDLMKRLKGALNDPEFQQVQIDKARQFAEKSIETAQKYGLKTEQGAALIADITNQMGEGGARKVLRRAGIKPGGEIENEAEALKKIEKATHRPNGRDRFNVIASAFSNGNPIRRRIVDDPTPVLA